VKRAKTEPKPQRLGNHLVGKLTGKEFSLQVEMFEGSAGVVLGLGSEDAYNTPQKTGKGGEKIAGEGGELRDSNDERFIWTRKPARQHSHGSSVSKF